ncbi:PEP-CTERM sorting domain-containing protein, partial [Paucibacter sp. B2R-40]|uniref:PEP-CTERM sorting domain-containing protein n=1 Tax=Paucibacter sp. B2R-40 TaxID=2893554 RepID=UPI0021E420A5
LNVTAGVLSLGVGFTNSGTVKGSGTLASATVINSGHVAPAEAIGTFAVVGNFEQTALGFLDVELHGAGSHDLLTVTGSAFLDGTLNIVCFANCSLEAGESFVILDASPNALNGVFSKVIMSGFGSGEFQVIYDRANGDVRLNVLEFAAAVPEPSTYLLFLSGGLLIPFLRRRQRSKV